MRTTGQEFKPRLQPVFAMIVLAVTATAEVRAAHAAADRVDPAAVTSISLMGIRTYIRERAVVQKGRSIWAVHKCRAGRRAAAGRFRGTTTQIIEPVFLLH